MNRKYRVLLITGIIFLIISLIFIAYPTFSSLINKYSNNTVITNYSETVNTLSDNEIENYFKQAQEYNENIANAVYNTDNYYNILNFNSAGIIGTVEIPKINVSLPIYHGTDEDVLSKGAGHLETSSLPIGGASTHSVISAHTAYPNKIFFDDLTEIEIGDVFYVNILSQTLKYEVCDINIVEPDDTSKIQIIDGKDYVSLMTCYPYAVNSHRLIVTGERVLESNDGAIFTDIDIDTDYNYICLIIVIIAILLLIILMLIKLKRANKERRKNEK